MGAFSGLPATFVMIGALALACGPRACSDVNDDDDEGVELVRVDGGEWDGSVIIAGTRVCGSDEGRCQFATDAVGLKIPGLREGQRSFSGIVGDAGVGASTVSADGGVLVFEWPVVEGHVFAAPAVGELIEVRLGWVYLGEGCPDASIEVLDAEGRLLVCEGLNGYDGPLFALTYENAGRTCSVPVAPDREECCCTTVEPVLMEVRSDPPVELAECEEAIVQLDGRSVFVQIRGAARAEMWDCGDDGDAARAAGLAVAIIE